MWFLFFFWSRRRHTRCYRDWSSDVCSSDLLEPRERVALGAALLEAVGAGEEDDRRDPVELQVHRGAASEGEEEERRRLEVERRAREEADEDRLLHGGGEDRLERR